jgi:hypothetical protein
MSSIRVVVKIPESIYPELTADLAKVDLRDRAERLRMLAMLGLRDSQHHRLPQGSRETSEDQPTREVVEDQKIAASNLIRTLTRSL